MRIEDLGVFKNKRLLPEEMEKLKIVIAFYHSLPTQAMKDELLRLIERQPSMLHREFETCLDDFAVKVRSVCDFERDTAHFPDDILSRLH